MLSTVAGYLCIGEAECALTALDAAGIDAVLADDQIVAIDWLYSNAVGYVKVRVRDEDAEEAAAILSEPAEEAPADADVAESEPNPQTAVKCPSCGRAETVARIPRLQIFLLLAVVLIGVGTAVGQIELALAGVAAAALITVGAPSHRCTACGEKWTESSRERTAPPPDPSDMIEVRCPRCGSAELNLISHRRLIAFSMIFNPMPVIVAAIWLFLPKRQCDDCEYVR